MDTAFTKETCFNLVREYVDYLYSFLSNTYVVAVFWTYIISFFCIFIWHLLRSHQNSSEFYIDKLTVLNKAIMENNVVESIQIIEKYPKITNMALNKMGYTPFLRACFNGNTQLVKYMLHKGADVSSATARKETAFYLAAYNRICDSQNLDASCLHALFHAGADIDAPNDMGYSALQMAAMFGHTPLVKWLIAKDANSAVSPHPYMLARSQGHSQTATVLKTKLLRAIMDS